MFSRVIQFLIFFAWHFTWHTTTPALVSRTINTSNADSSYFAVIDTTSQSAEIKGDSLYFPIAVPNLSTVHVQGFVLCKDTLTDSVFVKANGSLSLAEKVSKGSNDLSFSFVPTHCMNWPNRIQVYSKIKRTASERTATGQDYSFIYWYQ